MINNELDQVVESGSTINFGGRFSFENSAPTAYRSSQGKGEFYDLQSVLFYLKNQGLNYGDYLKATKEKGVLQVKLLDRKDLVDYLTGKREKSDYVQVSAIPSSAAGDEAPAKRARIDGSAAGAGAGQDIEMVPAADTAAEHSALRTIIANERQLRDRNTMLSVPGRSFKRVLDLLDSVVKEEIARNAREEERKEAARKKAELERQKKEGVAPQPSGRYQRETAPDGALQQMGAQNLGLQQVGFAAGPSTATQEPAPAPPPPPAAQTQREPEKRPAPKSSSKPSSGSGAKEKAKPQLLRNPTPIIMVPPGGSSLINMLNAPEFLTDGNFKTPQEAEAAGAKLPQGKTYHTILRKIGRAKPIKYHITDKEPTSKADWDRVVGVFCLGKPWQFKKFPFTGASNGDLVDTFQRVSGVFLHYSDEPIDAQVKKWNVKMIKIGRHSREADADAVRAFWTHIDGFIKSHKKGLIY